ncbi:hypothetical protein CRENBAI_022210 [Crenichthys baileyi]|uniref:Uncharacterized protein n=1 Tax=Crenichthys baileyi TaxID=28760 RepID=A0AAV9SDA6_9TELE
MQVDMSPGGSSHPRAAIKKFHTEAKARTHPHGGTVPTHTSASKTAQHQAGESPPEPPICRSSQNSEGPREGRHIPTPPGELAPGRCTGEGCLLEPSF